ncbi:type II toxin-antitoxin system VapC family toxin [Mucilaginibacter ginsenosidivorans]|uniref:Type II toxin-antitoxin system VapC family toxin n=1 Tax=Mucilaginibacter ginsenosidivorans TaxID=398053 RepID=A0A5B8V3U5_9SPHI|nr:type II toxin-antitoxin system VapC family toxin [Mucilaginibacter ginsenosidivorans]QEC65371.1 type II toxin-antitoxin system VapC family toxin [Mucilaginibacter ginsenosidivorans]
MGYVIDSNAVIDYLSGQMPDSGMAFMNNIVNDTPVVSVITQIEVLGFNNPAEIETLLNGFIEDSLVIPLNDEIVRNTIEIRKKSKIKTPDAIIAATSIALNYTLVTRNTHDFKNLNSLKTTNPWLL